VATLVCEHALGGNKELADRRACGIRFDGPRITGDREWIGIRMENGRWEWGCCGSFCNRRVTSNKQAAVAAIEMLLQVTENANKERSPAGRGTMNAMPQD